MAGMNIGIDGANADKALDALPTVSVIVATYHRDSALEKALLSLVGQTYKSVEIIVIDDNADEMWSQRVDNIICSVGTKFDRQIIYIKNDVNKGSAETRNIGIRAASGEYITFLDDDDIYLPDKIKNQVEYMVEENSDYCITDLDLYDENDRLIERRNRKYIRQNNQEALLRYHFMYHMTGTDTTMFKKDYLLSIGGFPPVNVGDEFYLMQEAIRAGGVFSYLPVCDIKAYVHTATDGLSNGDSKINGENALYEYKKQHIRQLGFGEKRYVKMRHYAVLAFAELRKKRYLSFSVHTLFSFVSSPAGMLRLLLNLKK